MGGAHTAGEHGGRGHAVAEPAHDPGRHHGTIGTAEAHPAPTPGLVSVGTGAVHHTGVDHHDLPGGLHDADDALHHHHHGAFPHHGVRVGVGLGLLPFYAPWNAYAYPYYPYGPPLSMGAPTPYLTPPAGTGRRIAVPGPAGTDSLVVEELSVVDDRSRTVTRLTWQGGGRQVDEVALFLADSARKVLAVQTLSAEPFTALFEPPVATAVAGMTIVWPGGEKSTTLVAYRP